MFCAVGWANSPVAAPMVGNGARANLPTTCGRDHAPLPTLHALNFTPVARMERSAIREQPIHALSDGKGRSRISLRFIRATGRASSKQRAPAVASRRLGKSACRGADGGQSGLANLPTICLRPCTVGKRALKFVACREP